MTVLVLHSGTISGKFTTCRCQQCQRQFFIPPDENNFEEVPLVCPWCGEEDDD